MTKKKKITQYNIEKHYRQAQHKAVVVRKVCPD